MRGLFLCRSKPLRVLADSEPPIALDACVSARKSASPHQSTPTLELRSKPLRSLAALKGPTALDAIDAACGWI
jgi:hypothetical protein